MIRVLLACGDNQFLPYYHCKNVGRLLLPQYKNYGQVSIWHDFTGIDNSAFTEWHPKKFSELLIEHQQCASRTKWVCLPDVVGDWKETLARAKIWIPYFHRLGYNAAYVLQDDQPVDEIPWDAITAVFLGGSTEFKLSQDALRLLTIAREREKLIHVGRCNSFKRIRHFYGKMDSFDGLSYSKFRQAKIPNLLKLLSELENNVANREEFYL